MSVSETDLELLETYLDGEITSAEEKALLARLIGEPHLAAAFAQVKSERQVRHAVWESCEPDDELVATLMMRVERKIDDQWAWGRRLSGLKKLTAAAACILVGVMVGRVGGGPAMQAPTGQSPVASADQVAPASKVVARPARVPMVDEYGRFVGYTTDGESVSPERPDAVPGNNVVPVADEF